MSLGSRGVVVAVVDSGWRSDIPHARVRPGVGFDPHTRAPLDDASDRIGHGTSCADLILATAPVAEVIPVRIFEQRLETSIDLLCEGLLWAVSAGADLISLSVGTSDDGHRPLLERVVEVVREERVHIVAAAGDGTVMPAILDDVVGVGRLPSRAGNEILVDTTASVQCLAPADFDAVLHRSPFRVPMSGVSLATAFVAGRIASLGVPVRRYATATLLERLAENPPYGGPHPTIPASAYPRLRPEASLPS